MLEEINILKHHGKQYIPDVHNVKLPDSFKNGRPVISNKAIERIQLEVCQKICPSQAISIEPTLSIDLGKCVFCGECEHFLGKEKINFTNDYKTATNQREGLIVQEGRDIPIELNPDLVRKEIRKYFGNSLKLRQVSAAGDNSAEWELGASSNPNFDMARFGIQFLASPRHCDGIVITGPISENMSEALQICYDAVPNPKVIIVVGTDAISGGIFQGSAALNRSFLDKYKVDLYVPGNPPHPLTFICGILSMMGQKK